MPPTSKHNAGAVQFQLEPADPERTEGNLLLTGIAFVSCADPTDPERRLRYWIETQENVPVPGMQVPISAPCIVAIAAFLVMILTTSCGEKTRRRARSSSASVSFGGHCVSVP